ncbi:hypothetical protein ACWEWX_46975 [Streptomyces asiaticus]
MDGALLAGVHGVVPGLANVDPAGFVRRVAPQEVCLPSTTVAIRWEALGVCPVDALSTGGARLGAALIDGSVLFPDAIAGAALRRLVGADAAPRLVPLCYLAEHPGGGYHAYAQIRFHPEDACFVRTTRKPVGHGPVTALRWPGPVLSAHAESSVALNNHLRYFRTHFAGMELEYKYTLDPAPDIWAASLELLKALRDGELEGCRPEYREEFQIHHTENHLFDVVGPEQEIGYASFIPTVSEALREMERIDSWLRSYLAAHGWTKQHTFYPKRSFLRDAVTARPELAQPRPAARGGQPQ